jgi:hypothetical protein
VTRYVFRDAADGSDYVIVALASSSEPVSGVTETTGPPDEDDEGQDQEPE